MTPLLSSWRLWLALVVGLLLFGSGYGLRDLQCKAAQQKQIAQQAQAIQRQSEQARKAEQVNVQNTAAIAENLQKEIQNEKATNDQLRSDIRRGVKRLSVRTRASTTRVSATGTSPGSDHATERAELHEEDADHLVAIGNDADDTARQLGACQELLIEDRRLVNAE